MKYKVYISQVWTYSTFIEAKNREEADNIAGEIAQEITPNYNNVYFENGRRMTRHMVFVDEYVEVEPVKGEDNA